ncbi:MAG: pseudouridine synthase [Bryobacteraceae bacterium]
MTSTQPRKKTLDRVLSQSGAGSRTEARRWIGEGRVAVNGSVVRSPDAWVEPGRDRVSLDGAPLEAAEPVYVLLYKPKGYVTTRRDPEGRPTVYDLIRDVSQFVGTAGRLDLDSSGLLLLTNDHALADRVTSPEHHVEKEYLVKASTLLTDEQLDRLRRGVDLDDGPTRPAAVVRERDSEKYTFFRITITEGRNRQVRRMVEAIGSRVLKLVRVRLGSLGLEGLEPGKWRHLTAREVEQLGGSPKKGKENAGQKSKGKLLVSKRDRAVLGGRGGRARVRD